MSVMASINAKTVIDLYSMPRVQCAFVMLSLFIELSNSPTLQSLGLSDI